MSPGAPAISSHQSLAQLAKEAIQNAILAGEYLPGQRLVEEQLCTELGISRPPLREALRELTMTGLVQHLPRKGVRVRPMTQHDVFEIVTLRQELERMAMRLALPNLDPERVARCWDALRIMDEIADRGEEGAMTRAGFEFHFAVVGLAGHHRLETTYRSMAMQLQLSMAMNNQARREVEDLHGNVARHRTLLTAIEGLDIDVVFDELDAHGNRTFLAQVVDELEGATPESQAWLTQLRQESELL